MPWGANVKNLKILVADDESIIRLGLKRILEQGGHTVYAVGNGRAAVELAESSMPDMAILDIKMPEMDGLEAARLLLERLQIPVIFLTAYGDKDLVERAARLPVMGYLVKPIKEAELLAMIEVASRRYEEHANTSQAAAEMAGELRSRRTIDRAKGLIMRREGLSEFEAYERLRLRASRERRTLVEAAEEEIGEVEALDDTDRGQGKQGPGA
jgi:AmiR/NasT family two-component response regulator